VVEIRGHIGRAAARARPGGPESRLPPGVAAAARRAPPLERPQPSPRRRSLESSVAASLQGRFPP
jgi:hypothetical protein